MGRGTCGAEEQDQVGPTNVCPKGWSRLGLPGSDGVGLAAGDVYNRGVAGTISFCELCGTRWQYPFSEEDSKSVEAMAERT